MIRIIAKIFAVTVVLTVFLRITPLLAASVTYVSNSGDDANACTSAKPCASIYAAYLALTVSGGQVTCLNSPGMLGGGNGIDLSITIDCAGVFEVLPGGHPGFTLFAANQVQKIRNLTISGTNGAASAIKVTGSGTLILENCVFENLTGIALDIEPTGALNLVIKNSRISNNEAAGVLIKPASGGASVTATFDGVTITNNAGGLKTDTTNGPVTVDISNSIISKNANNGIVVLGGAGGPNMVTAKNDVIATNGQAGIEASGGTAAVLVNNTLLDSNTGGATLAVSGGRVLTYGNNSIIGTTGSGFTGPVPLQ